VLADPFGLRGVEDRPVVGVRPQPVARLLFVGPLVVVPIPHLRRRRGGSGAAGTAGRAGGPGGIRSSASVISPSVQGSAIAALSQLASVASRFCRTRCMRYSALT